MTSTTLPADRVRELTTGLQTRDLVGGTQVRAADDEAAGRGVSGIAVPWDTQIEFWGIREEFAPGSVVTEEDNPPQLFWRHREVIGGLTAWEDRDAGWHIDASISDTTQGRDAHTLAKDGHVRKFSIGFLPQEWEERHETDDDGREVIVLRYTKVLAREVSLVPHPAYSATSVDEVRQDPRTPTVTSVREAQPTPTQEDTMSETTLTRADLDEVRTAVEDLDRELKLVGSQVNADKEPEGDQFRSFGEYVKAVAAGDETALRAYSGATSGDTITQDAWVGDVIRLGAARQRVTSLFNHTKDLPPEGMNVEYGYLKSDTTQVGVQANEGDDLLYGKVSLGTATSGVETLGGWTQLTRQEIERSSVNVLDFSFRAMALRYAKAIETLTRGVLTATYNDATATALAEVEADLTTQDGVVEGLIDLVEHFEDNDVNLSGLLVAKDAFLDLLGVAATDRILQVTQAPEDKLGTLTVSSISGNIAGLKVSLWPSGPTGAVVAYDETAIRTQEAPGAPMRLQDENIVNLSKSFSVYGYAASYVQVRPGLVKVVAPAAG